MFTPKVTWNECKCTMKQVCIFNSTFYVHIAKENHNLLLVVKVASARCLVITNQRHIDYGHRGLSIFEESNVILVRKAK